MSRRPPGDNSYHCEQIAKACRALFQREGTVEEALDAVLQAAKHEYGWRIIVHHPAEFRIDGYEYRWPDA